MREASRRLKFRCIRALAARLGMSHRHFHLERLESFLRTRLAGQGNSRPGAFRPALTLSRQYGIDTGRIGRALVEYLDGIDDSSVHGWTYLDQALVAQVIEDRRLPVACEPYVAEGAKFPGLDGLEKVLGVHRSQWRLFHHAAAAIRTLCAYGSVIVAGRAGNYLTADLPNAFHVRLVASEERRIARVRHSQRLSHEDAETLVRKGDRARAAYVKRYTGCEIDDPRAYHLVLNAENLSDEVLVRIVADSLVEWAGEQDHDFALR
jgi:cytidylate kinase